MKTELTRRIEQCVMAWHPEEIGKIKINKMRGEITALEVVCENGTTTAGIVDAMRISEFFGQVERRSVCTLRYYKNGGINICGCCKNGKENDLPLYCEEHSCRFAGCKIIGVPCILVSCFEIKISVSDFKSSHGHNFIGNLNYYVVPKEIFDKIEPMVPRGIGVLVFIDSAKYCGLRIRRAPEYRELSDSAQKWMILSVLKRSEKMWRNLKTGKTLDESII